MRLSDLVALICNIYWYILLARVIMSWLPQRSVGSGVSRLGNLVYELTEPLLRPIRQALSRYQGGMPIDFSPLVLILLIYLAQGIVVNALQQMGL